VNHMGFR